MVKRNTVQVKLIQGNEISNEKKPDIQSFKELVEKGSKTEEIKKPGLLISRVDYPITVKYGDDVIRVSPRSKLKIANTDKLGGLVEGLFLKKISK